MSSRHSNRRDGMVVRAFAWIVRFWPARSREWALAMQAELPETKSTRESLLWLVGGVMSLTKAWWREILQKRALGDHEETPRIPMAAAVLLVLCALTICVPSVREGVMSVFDTWHSSSVGLSANDLASMARKAEKSSDAETMAFVAMRMTPSLEQVRLADRAIAMNSNLTWIYYELERAVPADPAARARMLERVEKLEKWAPENAVPHLMRADIAFEEFYAAVFSKGPRGWNAGAELLSKNPQWSEAMDAAFRASQYDDYIRQRIDLDLAVLRKHKINRPLYAVYGMYSSRIPNLLSLRTYSDCLLHIGEQQENSGNISGATENYWRVANLGQSMQLKGGSIIERLIGGVMIERSFEHLQTLLSRTGHADEARYAAYEILSVRAQREEIRNRNQTLAQIGATETWSAVMLHVSAVLMLLFGFLSCVSLVALRMRRRANTATHPPLWKGLRGAAIVSPALLSLSVVIFYANYYPYLESFRHASSRNSEEVLRTFGGLLALPEFLWQAWTYGGHNVVFFWKGVIALGSAIAIALIARMAYRWKMTRKPA